MQMKIYLTHGKLKKILQKNEITSAILISTEYWIYNGLNVWLEMYHCLICDGYCIFDLFSQSRCNTHHAPKKYITNVDWCNTHHKPKQNWKCISNWFAMNISHIWLIFQSECNIYHKLWLGQYPLQIGNKLKLYFHLFRGVSCHF